MALRLLETGRLCLLRQRTFGEEQVWRRRDLQIGEGHTVAAATSGCEDASVMLKALVPVNKSLWLRIRP